MRDLILDGKILLKWMLDESGVEEWLKLVAQNWKSSD